MTMPTFSNRPDLVESLRICPWRQWLVAEGEKRRPVAKIIHDAVTSNTFRAFRNCRVPPSKAFRAWASASFTEDLVESLMAVRSEAEFCGKLESLSGSLRSYWLQKCDQEMGINPSLKLPSLMLKLAAARDPEGPAVSLLHVPLDSFTLLAIRDVFNLSSPTRRIPNSATMGWVQDLAEYTAIQRTIRECAKEAGVPPIAFDILVWDAAHGK